MIIILIALLAFIVGFWCGLLRIEPTKAKSFIRLEQQEELKKRI